MNYCRNPNSRNSGLWCFFGTRSAEWESCSIPFCDREKQCKDTPSGEEYDGPTNVTSTGTSCQAWASQYPHRHRYKESSFPEKNFSRIGNRCRNPDNDPSPWCYTSDYRKRWEYCSVADCRKKISQAEYFGGRDHLQWIGILAKEKVMNKLIMNMTIVLSISYRLWSENVQKKTSVWSSEYASSCQRDLNYFAYCHVDRISKGNNKMLITFECTQPLLSVVILSPLEDWQYQRTFQNGNLYTVNNGMGDSVKSYIKEVHKFQNSNAVPISLHGNGGQFQILDDNAFPYAVTANNKVVMTISNVGKGRIGIMGGEYFTDKKYQTELRDLFARVYGKSTRSPKHITLKYIATLRSTCKETTTCEGAVIWNAHRTIGIKNVNALVKMVRHGLNLIVGIKSWAYHYYVSDFLDSEIKGLLLAAGVWPSMGIAYGTLRIINAPEFRLFPVVHLLEIAKTNLTMAVAVSHLISDNLRNIPYREFSENPSGMVLLDKLKEKMSQLFRTYISVVRSTVPCIKKPLLNKEQRLLLDMFNSMLLNPLGNDFIAPGTNFYPGTTDDIKVMSESVQMKLKLSINVEKTFLGVALKESRATTISLKALRSRKCDLFVNFHLFDVSNWDWWNKWPRVTKRYTIGSNTTRVIRHSFGGLLAISCDSNDDEVELTLSDVIRVPMYDRRNGPVEDNWHELKRRNVPWAILASDSVVFVVPLIAIRNMEDPQPIMELWDAMVKEEFHLRGRSVADTRRELLSADVQIKAGYMHAGYPIGTFLQHVANPAVREKYLFAGEKIKREAYWGVTHEIGHNLQHKLFTFLGTVEVTTNIFTLVSTETMTGISSWSPSEGWASGHRLPDIVTHINGRNFSFWQSKYFVALGTYAQLRAEFGWEFYRQIFRRYDDIIAEYGERVDYVSDEEKIQLWMLESSKLVAMNLLPLYDYWAWPITKDTRRHLERYTPFFPDDFLTKMMSNKTSEILAKYGGERAVSREPRNLTIIVGPLKNPLSIEGRRVIEYISLI